MIKTKKQMFIVVAIFAILLLIGGTTYAWFSYRKEGASQTLIAGDIYLKLEEGNDTISLTNIFPETKEEARARDDNYITFEIKGVNESDRTIYYEIDINHGTDKSSPYVRFDDEDLRFDLVELDSNGDEVRYLLNAVSYDTLVNKKIWADEVSSGSSVEVSKKYKLRMWLSENVLISDSDPTANYLATGYKNHYANIKVSVIGDFNEKYFAYQKVKKAILNKATSGGSCNNITYEDDGIIYISGSKTCIDFNYVWYSGKLWRITAIYPDGSMKLVTQNNITSIAFNASYQNNFYTNDNTTSYMYQWLNEDFYDTLYNANDFIVTNKQWNATDSNASSPSEISTKLSETTMLTANVGLLNSYEYYNSYRCNGSATCTGSSYVTGYLNIGYYWWLLNPYGYLYLWGVYDNGYGTHYVSDNDFGSRPSIYLKSEIKFTGDGTSTSPYKLVGDKDIGQANDLVNTRLSGEYVKLDNGTTNQLFRIIGVEDSKTKIIAIDYVENRNTRKFATGSSDTLWGSGTTADTDTWYTYLNTTSIGYLDTLKSTYGELFDGGTYYLGTSGHNYKLSVCANTTSGNTKVCDKTNDKGTFNIGLPRYGEMFATQQAGGYSNSINMWLMNRYNASNVWGVSNYGDCSRNNPTGAFGARPTLHLKSTVKILSGSGTETDPYVVGL